MANFIAKTLLLTSILLLLITLGIGYMAFHNRTTECITTGKPDWSRHCTIVWKW